MGTTQQLADFVAGSTYEQLPSRVLQETREAILNYLGVAIGASGHEAVRILTDEALDEGGHPQATILGTGTKVSAVQAARINGSSSHVFDYDDTDLETIIHPTGPVLSAILALAEWKGFSGKQLLAAEAIGAEAEIRIGTAVYPRHYDVGWHITGTVGAFGAAAASCWMLGLDGERTSNALGLAATQASGLREMFGYHAKCFHVGEAAARGLSSALLAARGFTASTQALEAKRGFCAVLSGEYDLSKATRGLGSEWMLPRNGLKPYACGVVTHPTIDGVRRIREKYGIKPEDVREIELQVHPLVLELTGKTHPATGLEGKFSIFFCAAIALIQGKGGFSQFTDEKVNRPDVVALRDKVRAIATPGIKESQAVVTIRTTDGREIVEKVEAASGTPDNPLSRADLLAKFHDLVGPVLPREQADRLVEAALHVDDLANVSELTRLTTP